ncbi:MAG: type VI secretion system tip protein VgrG [Myxococcales bacterium]|nr:type VI secretion system tip protein VgrG [Myxococcales bacterium]
MTTVAISLENAAAELTCEGLTMHEALGEPTRIDLDTTTRTFTDPKTLLGLAAAIAIEGAHGRRLVRGVVTRAAAHATSDPEALRRLRLRVESWPALLEHRHRSRVFQHTSVPELVKRVLVDAGLAADAVRLSLVEDHPEREYVVQYDESDAAFVRRLCEEDGLYFRFEAEEGDGAEIFVLEDQSTSAPPALAEPLSVGDGADLAVATAVAWDFRAALRRRPGKVTLRDYNQETPAVALEGVAEAGTDVERSLEIYEAPGRFLEPSQGAMRASRRLESLRADASVVTFATSALGLVVGQAVALAASERYVGQARPDGDYFVTSLRHGWQRGRDGYRVEAEAIPLAAPFRLARRTPRPRIFGVQRAWVTGAPGEEIHVDDQGRVRVHFDWDREGPRDDQSSLPIRAMQPNTPGSMLLPRVGWEVLVAFEDGDPDRPYVIGRTYNAKFPPPYGLPANKTVTTLASYSSPGGAKQNEVRFDDAAGRQNISFNAAFARTLEVANNLVTQTIKNENLEITGSQTRTVGANETVSVTEAYTTEVGSQTASVGAKQSIYAQGNQYVTVGSESVIVGAACLEKVGNPVTGLKNLAVSAALAGAGQLGTAGAMLGRAATLAQAGYQGYQSGGLRGALGGVASAGLGMAADLVPGGGALLGAVTEACPPPWAERPAGGGSDAAGGGAAGASDTTGPAGAGPGHRNNAVKGAFTELVGGRYGVVTPGSIGWTSIGASTLVIGGSHGVRANTTGQRIAGLSSDTLGALKIKTKTTITRTIKGALSTTIAGALRSSAGGKHSIKAGASLKIDVGGTLTLEGSHVSFIVGGSKVSTSPGGLLIEASTITVTGATKQSAKTGHG